MQFFTVKQEGYIQFVSFIIYNDIQPQYVRLTSIEFDIWNISPRSKYSYQLYHF